MRAEEKEKLDEIEGVGKGYDNTSIEVPEFGCCDIYLGSASHICNESVPYDWYREIVLLGCRHLGFPVTYVSMIEAIGADPDPDEERSRDRWQFIERLRRGI